MRLATIGFVGFILGLSSCSEEDGVKPVQMYLFSGVPDIIENTYAPLSATLSFETIEPVSVHLKVFGKNGPTSDVEHTFTDLGLAHQILVLGLYPDHNNTFEITVTSEDGLRFDQNSFQLRTPPLPDYMAEIEIVHADEAAMDGVMNLVSYRGRFDPNTPFIFDQFGEVRWILDYTEHPTLSRMFYDVGMERLQNGNLYFGTSNIDAILEIDMAGNILNSWLLEGYDFHHNVQEKPNGNFLVTTTKYGSTHANGNATVEDYILEVDRITGEIINEWDLKQALDENRITWHDCLGNQKIDWMHANAVIYDPSDESIIVSGRHQGMVKLDYNNQVQWIMGVHSGWGKSRQGNTLNQFLLQPVNADGLPITDENVLSGVSVHPAFEWNWYQHAPVIMPNGNLMLFDNGDNRNYSTVGTYSRAVEYKIDETAMTIKQVWEYGKERGGATFSSIVSDVDYLAESNHILFCPGHIWEKPSGRREGRIIELDYTTREIYFEARIICPQDRLIAFHRAERLSLYP